MIDPRTLAREASRTEDENRDRFAQMTPEERLAILFELCALTDSITLARPDADALRAATPRSAESEALWARLMERKRAGGR